MRRGGPNFDLRVRYATTGDAAGQGALLEALIDDRLDAVVVDGLLPPSSVQRCNARLADMGWHHWPAQFGTRTVGGPVLDLSAGVETRYAEHVPIAEALRRDLFGFDPVEPLIDMLACWSGGRPVTAIRTDEAAFVEATIRVTEHGGFIPPHCDREQLRRPASAPVLPHVCVDDEVLAFVLYVQQSTAGGALRIHDLRWQQAVEYLDNPQGRLDVGPALEDRAFRDLRPDSGGLVVFAAGRFVHQVLPVVGPRPRITLSGFVARSADRSGFRIWN